MPWRRGRWRCGGLRGGRRSRGGRSGGSRSRGWGQVVHDRWGYFPCRFNEVAAREEGGVIAAARVEHHLVTGVARGLEGVAVTEAHVDRLELKRGAGDLGVELDF